MPASRKSCPISTARRARSSATTSRCAAITRMPRSFGSSRGACTTLSRRCCRSSWRRWRPIINSARPRSRESPGWRRRPTCSSPRTGCATATSFWADIATALLLKARLLNERNETDRAVRVQRHPDRRRLDRDATKPSFPTVPADWQVRQSPAGDVAPKETGWVVRGYAARLHQDRRRLSHASRQGRTRSRTSCTRTVWSRFRCSSSRRRRRRSRWVCRSRAESMSTAGSSNDYLVTVSG